MKNIFLYGAFLLIAGLVTLAQILGLSWADASIATFAVLLHAPSLVPVRVIRRAAGLRLGSYPETPFFALIFTAWCAAAALYGSATFALTAGAIFALSIGLQFGVVRAIDLMVLGGQFVGGHNPNFEASGMMAVIKRMAFCLRSATAVMSVVVLWLFLSEGMATYWWVPAVGLAPLVSIVAAVGSGLNLKETARRAAKEAGATVAASVADNPPKCVIYYSSSKTARHKQLPFSVRQFTNAGISTALISREPHSIRACEEARPDFLWRAYTLDTLDTFAQPSIRAAVYLNDASKNTHFIRFNEMAHILLAQTEPLSAEKSLKGNLAIYDAIVAPNLETAALWSRTSNAEVASRVVVIDHSVVPLSGVTQKSGSLCRLSLSLAPGALAKRDLSQGAEVLDAVLAWVADDPERSLTVSVCEAEADGDIRALQQTLKSASQASPRVTLLENADSLVHATSDILIATEADDLWGIAQAGKPVLLFGSHGGTDGIEPLWGDKDEVFARLNAAQSGGNIPDPKNFKRRKFGSLDELIDGVHAAKHPKGLQS